jgi:hypothetical protein
VVAAHQSRSRLQGHRQRQPPQYRGSIQVQASDSQWTPFRSSLRPQPGQSLTVSWRPKLAPPAAGWTERVTLARRGTPGSGTRCLTAPLARRSPTQAPRNPHRDRTRATAGRVGGPSPAHGAGRLGNPSRIGRDQQYRLDEPRRGVAAWWQRRRSGQLGQQCLCPLCDPALLAILNCLIDFVSPTPSIAKNSTAAQAIGQLLFTNVTAGQSSVARLGSSAWRVSARCEAL